MYIYPILNQNTNFNSKVPNAVETRTLKCALNDGSTGVVTITKDKLRNLSLQVIKVKDGRIVGGCNTACGNGVSKTEEAHFLKKIEDNVSGAKGFMLDFIKAMLS